MLLKRIRFEDLAAQTIETTAVDYDTLEAAKQIVQRVQLGGMAAVQECASQYDNWNGHASLVLRPDDFSKALNRISIDDRELLERTAARIRFFASQQAAALKSIETENGGVRMGMTWHPLSAAGCYVPGGRYPLVSSLLMTAVTARTAGCKSVWIACPVATDLMLAAAGICSADGFLAVGGAHAIAALTCGAGEVPASDVVVGPGNRWVTAAKQIVSERVKIDMLAGPSELVVFADGAADPATVAADLLAQAEHDVDARPILVTTSVKLADAVESKLIRQLADLPTGETARLALRNGFTGLVQSIEQGIEACQTLAPEHLELHLAEAGSVAKQISRSGCVFIGSKSAEVFGDYGAGPNHVLPTGGTARFASGLSVATFMRTQTWLSVDDTNVARSIVNDSIGLAELEGLSAHARSARMRKQNTI